MTLVINGQGAGKNAYLVAGDEGSIQAIAENDDYPTQKECSLTLFER
jgi:hypothetical protein